MNIQEKLKDKNFIKAFTRPFAIQRQEGLIKYNSKLALKDIIIIPSEQGGVGAWYVEKGQLKELATKISAIFSSEDEFSEHISSHSKGREEILDLLNEFNSKKDLDKEQLLYFYKKYTSLMESRFAEVYSAPFAVETFIVPKLKGDLEKQGFGKDWDSVTSPTELIELQKLQIEISELFLDGKLEENLPQIKEEYSWITIYGPGDKPADENYLKSLILGKTEEEIKNKIDSLKQNIEHSRKKLQTFLDKLENKELKNSLRNLNFYITFRNERMDTLRKIILYSNTFYTRLLKLSVREKHKINYEDIINLTGKEIIEYLTNGKLPNLYRLKLRTSPENYHYYHNGEFNLVVLKEDKEFMDELLNLKIEVLDKFPGTISSSGIVRGKVRIIYNHKDLGKVQEGDILVSDTTSPDYVIAMERAAAFVTDEGGVTCHAAIVAREMDKPCLTGTDIATKALNDGDLIEVDADNGFVRILERAKN